MKKPILIFGMLFLALAIFAQPPGEDLPDENVEVEKQFEAELPETNKYPTSPVLPTVTNTPPNLSYDIPNKLLNLEYDPPKIKPLAMPKQKLDKVYRFYAKAGFGLPASPYAEASYNSGRLKNNLAYDIGFLHHSANNDAKIENQRFSNTGGRVGATYYMPMGMAAGGYVSYGLKQEHYYGYNNADTSFTREAVQQRFSEIGVGGTFFNSLENRGSLDYKADLDIYNLSDNFDVGETGIDLKANVVKHFDDNFLTVNVGNLLSIYNDTANLNNNVAYVNPSYTIVRDVFKFKVGAFLASDGLDGVFFAAPDVELGLNLAGGTIGLFAGWNGSIYKNSFRHQTNYNPYTNSFTNIKNTRIQNRFAGVRGRAGTVQYEGKFSWKSAQNLALYLNDSTDYKKFNTVYDTAQIYNIHFGVEAPIIKKLVFSIDGNYNIFDLNNNARAWHLPEFEANFGLRFLTLDDKLTLKAELYSGSGMAYLDEAGEEQVLNALFDFNLGANYHFTENFGLFLDVNNLFNNQRERWYKYPGFGTNFLGGITVKF